MANPKYVPQHHSITIKEVKIARKIEFLVSGNGVVFVVSCSTPTYNKADKLALSIPTRWQVSRDGIVLSTHRYFAHAMGNTVTRAMKAK